MGIPVDSTVSPSRGSANGTDGQECTEKDRFLSATADSPQSLDIAATLAAIVAIQEKRATSYAELQRKLQVMLIDGNETPYR